MKKNLLFICCIGLMPFAKAQDTGAKTKEVIIEKKVSKPAKDKADSSMNVTVTINGDTTENIAIVIDGDKITINGEVVDASDPRLKKMKRGSLTNQPNLAFLGVATQIDPAGALIVDINETSPAAKAKLKIGDIITFVNETKIMHPEDLYTAIGKYKPSDKINLSYLRDKKSAKVTIVLEENPNKIQGMTFEKDALDLSDLDLLNEQGRKFKFSMPELPNIDQLMTKADKKPKLGISVEDLETGKGVKVTNVAEDSPAAKAGIQKGDILTQLNVAEITDVNFMKWQYYYPGQVLKITIDRKGEKRTVEVKIPKKINTADL